MLILVITAALLLLLISVAAVFIALDKYQKAKKKSDDLETRALAEAARADGRPRSGSGVDRSAGLQDLLRPDPHPARPETPSNRSEMVSMLTQPRPRPRSRQSLEAAAADMFEGMGTSLNSFFNDISQNMNSVVSQATQLANVATGIARDAQTLIDLGAMPDQIVINQSRSWNLRNITTLLGRGTRTLRTLETRYPGEYQHWGELVRTFMTQIQSGALVIQDNFTEVVSIGGGGAGTNPGVQATVTGPSGPRCSIGGQPTQPEAKASAEPEKTIPTRFERDEVI